MQISFHGTTNVYLLHKYTVLVIGLLGSKGEERETDQNKPEKENKHEELKLTNAYRLTSCYICLFYCSVIKLSVIFCTLIENHLSERKLLDGLIPWEKQTCIKFIPKKNHRDYVQFVREKNPKSRR